MNGLIISKAMVGTSPVQRIYAGNKEVYRITPPKIGPYVLMEDGNYLPASSFKGYGSAVEKGNVYANEPGYVTSRAATICVTESALNYYESIDFTFEKIYSSVYGDSYDVSYTVTNKDGTKNTNGGLYVFKKEVDGVLLTYSEGDEFTKTNFNHKNMNSYWYSGMEVPPKKLILSASPLKGKDSDKVVSLALFYKTEKAEGGFLLSTKTTDTLFFCNIIEEVPGCALPSYDEAELDMEGKKNTQAFLDRYSEEESPIPYACNSYIFPNGQRGYVPSIGQLKIISTYFNDIVSLAEKIWESFYDYEMFSSTQRSASALYSWVLSAPSKSTYVKNSKSKSCIIADIDVV